MIWAALLKSLVLGVVRGVLGIKGKGDAEELGRSLGSQIGDDILSRGVHPSVRPQDGTSYPLAYTDVERQQDQIRSAARAFPAKASTVPTLPPKARASAVPPPIMPAPSRPPRKR